MKRKTKHAWTVRGTALLLAAALLLATGCGNKNGTEGGTAKNGQGTDGQDGFSIQELAKGRYLESDAKMPEELRRILAMRVLADGSLAIFDGENGLYISEDEGKNFEKKEIGFPEHIKEKDFYTSKAAIGADGSVLAEYLYGDAEDGTSKAGYFYADADGKDKLLSIANDGGYHYYFLILKDGRLIKCDSEAVSEINREDGSLTRLCQRQGTLSYVQEIGDYLYMVKTDGLEIYDIKQEKFIEDTVLSGFFEDENTDRKDMDVCPVLLEPGDTEDSLYVATSRGLFRHVTGGSIMEELIKGSLCSLGAPEMSLSAMASLGADHFLICFDGSELKSYLYDEDTATLPEKTLKVYSLWENDAVRTAINLYQKEHANVTIDYAYGMTWEGGITKEDAIRNLNAELLAGNGPDVLVLDELPIRSYTEKGVLKDISPKINSLCESGELYENIATAFEDNGKIHAVPAFFSFPVISGEEGIGVTDLESLADRVEELRMEYPEGNILYCFRGKEVLMRLYNICSPDFVKKDGGLDAEMLKEFLTQAKRIWDAEKISMDPDIAEGYKEDKVDENEALAEAVYRQYERQCMHNLNYGYGSNYGSGGSRIMFGYYDSPVLDYAQDISCLKTLGKEVSIRLLDGLAGQHVFRTSVILGVNAAGSNQEDAEEFILSMLTGEVQTKANLCGYPVKREALKELFNKKEPGEMLQANSMSMKHGRPEDIFMIVIYQPEDEEAEHLYELIEQLKIPADTDPVVKDAVLVLGASALEGEKSIEEAVNDIVNRVQIYLEE